MGAAEQLLGLDGPALTGLDWRGFFRGEDAAIASHVAEDLAVGERRSQIRVRLQSQRPDGPATPGELSLFRPPGRAGRVACAFRRTGPEVADAAPAAPALLGRAAFEALTHEVLAEAAAAGLAVSLDLLELPGFAARAAALPAEVGEKTRQDVANALRAGSVGGYAAAEVAEDRFAVMRSADRERLLERLERLTGAPVSTASQPLSADHPPAHHLQALRFALDLHIEAGPTAAGEAFQVVLMETLRRAEAFRHAVAAGHVTLVYQPVVELRTRKLHHFEALARFDDAASPQDVIRLAEELNLIPELDFAVFARVVHTLHTEDKVAIAANLSARSLMEPGFVERIVALTAEWPGLAHRLPIEITETHALTDLTAASVRIEQLQRAGHTVCLDDYGAGAASLDYLRNLRVDVLKIDGRYIRALQTSPRDRAIVQHLAALCRDLGIAVIAEMIEDDATAQAVANLGIPLGQGWLFGKPTASLQWPPKVASARPALAAAG
jgi:EAL domain-containing protein (putative c-di-GMP-specific phosphodiesterase class I)